MANANDWIELRDRIEDAILTLSEMAEKHPEGSPRREWLRGKVNGCSLVLSYMDERDRR